MVEGILGHAELSPAREGTMSPWKEDNDTGRKDRKGKGGQWMVLLPLVLKGGPFLPKSLSKWASGPQIPHNHLTPRVS